MNDEYKMDSSRYRRDYIYAVKFAWHSRPNENIVRAVCCQCLKEIQSKIKVVRVSHTGSRQCDMCGCVNINI